MARRASASSAVEKAVREALGRFGARGPEHPVWKRRCRGLLLIGTGIPERHAMTLEALKALRACRLVFIPELAKGFKRLGDAAVVGLDEVVAEARRGGPVGVLTYGHPLLFGIGGEIAARCRSEGVPVSAVAGVSAIDAVLAAAGVFIGPGEAVFAGDLAFFERTPPDRDSHLIIYMPADGRERLARVLERCARVRSGRARAAFVECGNGESIPDSVVWTTLAAAPKRFARVTPCTTLLVLPAGR